MNACLSCSVCGTLSMSAKTLLPFRSKAAIWQKLPHAQARCHLQLCLVPCSYVRIAVVVKRDLAAVRQSASVLVESWRDSSSLGHPRGTTLALMCAHYIRQTAAEMQACCALCVLVHCCSRAAQSLVYGSSEGCRHACACSDVCCPSGLYC